MQGIVGAIETERDLRLRRAMSIEEHIDEQRLDGRWIVDDPMMARRRVAAQFQPVQGGFAGER